MFASHTWIESWARVPQPPQTLRSRRGPLADRRAVEVRQLLADPAQAAAVAGRGYVDPRLRLIRDVECIQQLYRGPGIRAGHRKWRLVPQRFDDLLVDLPVSESVDVAREVLGILPAGGRFPRIDLQLVDRNTPDLRQSVFTYERNTRLEVYRARRRGDFQCPDCAAFEFDRSRRRVLHLDLSPQCPVEPANPCHFATHEPQKIDVVNALIGETAPIHRKGSAPGRQI